MWKPFATSKEAFMLKFSHVNDNYEIYLTDLKKLWSGVFSEDIIIQNFKECNPMFDMEPEEAVSQVRKMFDMIDQAQVEVAHIETMMNLSLRATISEFKIKYTITLAKTEDLKFLEMITIPMIQTIHFLEVQQKMLCNLIAKKDRELEEYQLEKGLISRNDLITEKFEPNSLASSSENLILNTFQNSSKFMDQINQEYGEVTEKVVEVEVEVWNKGKKKRKIYDQSTTPKSTKIVYKR